MLSSVDKIKFFGSLQIFRGIAALMVVYHHQWNAFSHFFSYENELLEFLAAIGKYGVDFFFVLSGFIITYTNFHRGGEIREIQPYLLNRMVRIYIPYLPIGMAMLMLYNLFESVSAADREVSWLTSLTLIPHGVPALSVAWTLVFEMMFYVLFILWFISKRAFNCFVIFWMLLILDKNYFHFLIDVNHGSPIWSYFLSFYNLAFILGHVIARAYVVFPKPAEGLLWVGFGGAFLVLYIKWIDLPLFSHAYNLLMFICFGLMIRGSLNINVRQIRTIGFLLGIGNAPYSIYLIHNPVISFLVRIFPRFEMLMLDVLVFVSGFIICCLAGIFYSKIFEGFLLKKAKGSIGKHFALVTN